MYIYAHFPLFFGLDYTGELWPLNFGTPYIDTYTKLVCLPEEPFLAIQFSVIAVSGPSRPDCGWSQSTTSSFSADGA